MADTNVILNVNVKIKDPDKDFTQRSVMTLTFKIDINDL